MTDAATIELREHAYRINVLAGIAGERGDAKDAAILKTAALFMLAKADGDESTAERDTALATVADLTAKLAAAERERDDLAKSAFSLADEIEQSKDCGDSDNENCCGECVKCREATFVDAIGQRDAALRAEIAKRLDIEWLLATDGGTVTLGTYMDGAKAMFDGAVRAIEGGK